MRKDEIIEIGIDKSERLYIKPKSEKFTMIYRSASEVHWDNEGLFLYSPKPREWTYIDWFKYIVSLIKTDCDCRLLLTDKTKWINVDSVLKKKLRLKINNERPTMCIIHKGFGGFRAVSRALVLGANLISLKPAIPYEIIH